MGLFDEVKQYVDTRDAAEKYGIEVNRYGFALCPFHADQRPSMKVDRRFHCFGCGADGDVIDFTGRLFNIGSVDAAKKLVADFRLPVELHRPASVRGRLVKTPAQLERERAVKYRHWKDDTIAALCDCLSDYQHWMKAQGTIRTMDDITDQMCRGFELENKVNDCLDELMMSVERDPEKLYGMYHRETEDVISKVHALTKDRKMVGVEH